MAVISVGPIAATAAGGSSWANASYALTENGLFAVCTVQDSAIGFSFDFSSVPSNAYITSFVIEVKAKTTGGVGYMHGSFAGVTLNPQSVLSNAYYSTNWSGLTIPKSALTAGLSLYHTAGSNIAFYIDNVRLTYTYIVPTAVTPLTDSVATVTESIDIVTAISKPVTDSVASVTETISVAASDSAYAIMNNNQCYVMNTDNMAWSYVDNHPFSHQIYRPATKDMIGSRRDNAGQISVIGLGGSFGGADIIPDLQTGYMNFGQLDEMKTMPDNASQGIKKLRAFFNDMIGTGVVYLDVITENQTTTLTLNSNASVATLQSIRTALSRDIRGKYISFRLYSTDGASCWIGETGIKVKPKNIR
jgi:hypothetical protein